VCTASHPRFSLLHPPTDLLLITTMATMADYLSRSSSPARSVDAAAVSDAAAPRSPDIDEDKPLYPLEGKYLDEADREELLSLPEIKRESVLAQRKDDEIRRQQDLQLRRALAENNKTPASAKSKRKAEDDLDGGRRTRPKAEKAKSALDDYRRARELKGTERGRRDADRGRKDERSPSSAGSDRDAEGESEVEWAEPSSDTRASHDPPADLKDFDRCRLGRSAFARVCFYPGFENAIEGCFARVSTGQNRETGQNMYRMTQIKGFTEGKPYHMEGSNGKQFLTDQYAIVAHGKAQKAWQFNACSDGHFTDQEFDRYISTLKNDNIRIPTKKYLYARLDAIHGLLNTDWTDEMLSKKFAKQREMQAKHDPVNVARTKRQAIEKRKAQAEESGDAEEVMRCDAELAALENNSSAVVNGNGARNSPFKPTKNAALAQQERMAAVNLKNRGKNAEEVRKALIEEGKKKQRAREQAAAEMKAKAEAEAAKKAEEEEAKKRALLDVPKGDDLFGDGSSDLSRAATPVGGDRTPMKRSRTGTPMNGVKKEKKPSGPIGAITKKAMDDEIIGSMDLGIDIEI
jgi:RNA polymerase-associated protein RTF1